MQSGDQVSQSDKRFALTGETYHPPEHFTREGFLRQWLTEGLFTRYTIHAKAVGKEFVVEGIDDPTRLPTYQKSETGATIAEGKILDDPAVAAAVKTVIDRLIVEMEVIEKTGFISYFLIVGDFIRYGRSKDISCVARGSAAGSLVTYLLEIAHVVPSRYGLLFERFPEIPNALWSAGYRHRLAARRSPRRRHRVCAPEIWQ